MAYQYRRKYFVNNSRLYKTELTINEKLGYIGLEYNTNTEDLLYVEKHGSIADVEPQKYEEQGYQLDLFKAQQHTGKFISECWYTMSSGQF